MESNSSNSGRNIVPIRNLPAELLDYIGFNHVPDIDQAMLALTCKSFHGVAKVRRWEALPTSLKKNGQTADEKLAEERMVVQRLERDNPNLIMCIQCAKLCPKIPMNRDGKTLFRPDCEGHRAGYMPFDNHKIHIGPSVLGKRTVQLHNIGRSFHTSPTHPGSLVDNSWPWKDDVVMVIPPPGEPCWSDRPRLMLARKAKSPGLKAKVWVKLEFETVVRPDDGHLLTHLIERLWVRPEHDHTLKMLRDHYQFPHSYPGAQSTWAQFGRLCQHLSSTFERVAGSVAQDPKLAERDLILDIVALDSGRLKCPACPSNLVMTIYDHGRLGKEVIVDRYQNFGTFRDLEEYHGNSQGIPGWIPTSTQTTDHVREEEYSLFATKPQRSAIWDESAIQLHKYFAEQQTDLSEQRSNISTQENDLLMQDSVISKRQNDILKQPSIGQNPSNLFNEPMGIDPERPGAEYGQQGRLPKEEQARLRKQEKPPSPTDFLSVKRFNTSRHK
ncbi:hypothetical protein B0H63DRAFT_215828 [Podospora didyma]|uniref:F-box domain-containing protein n=1 Tax=Podospora didyma TaxID=330526 RepID=A0AAE0NI38_9PEZI|nr:hypothetical protein B0H63DRAFT_215828 [Podospora didyma]